MLKVWIKFILWATIITNVIGAGRITRIHLEVAKEAGGFFAWAVALCILIFFGIILGSIYFGINILILGKDKVIKNKPTNNYCIGLAIIVMLIAYLGNFETLIIVGCYLLIRKIVKSIRKQPFVLS